MYLFLLKQDLHYQTMSCWQRKDTISPFLAGARDKSVALPHIQRLFPKGRGSEQRPYDESPELQSSCHKFCVVTLLNLKIFSGR